VTINITKHPFSRRRITHVLTGHIESITVDRANQTVKVIVAGKTHRFYITLDKQDVALLAMMAGDLPEGETL